MWRNVVSCAQKCNGVFKERVPPKKEARMGAFEHTIIMLMDDFVFTV